MNIDKINATFKYQWTIDQGWETGLNGASETAMVKCDADGKTYIGRICRLFERPNIGHSLLDTRIRVVSLSDRRGNSMEWNGSYPTPLRAQGAIDVDGLLASLAVQFG